MRLTIHKGTHEVGGTCIELEQDKMQILLDLGSPLNDDSRPINIENLKPDAVLITHPHQDHYGLIEQLEASVPIYISELGRNLIDSARIFSRQPLLDRNFIFG